MPLPITGNVDGQIRMVKLNSGQGFGLESDSMLGAKKKFAIRVSENIDYAVSFWIKQTSVEPSLELSMTSYNCEFDKKLISKNIINGSPETFFVRNTERIMSTPNRYHFCRFIIHSKNTAPNLEQPLNSMASGRNLIMQDTTTNIFINLKCIKDSINIWDFKVKPARTPFSTDFLGNSNMLQIWRKNNKKHMSDDEIDNLAKDYLLPYNAINAVINL